MKPPIYRHRRFGYNLALLPNPHLAALERGVTCIEEAIPRSGLTIGYPGWGFIYHLLLSHLDPEHEQILVETGTNQGCTTIVLAQALKDSGCKGKIITVELKPENVEIARNNLVAAGVDDIVDLRHGNSHDLLPQIAREISHLRFAFIDASHLCKDAIFEFETLLPILADNALVVFDNTYQIADESDDQLVNGALRRIHKEHGGNIINMECVSWYTPGLAIWQKRPFSIA